MNEVVAVGGRMGPPRERWLSPPCKVTPGRSPGRGRGLFAVQPIAAGELIELACTAEISAEQCLALDRMPPLGDHYFAHPEDERRGLMLFGLVSLANHAEPANAAVRFAHSSALGWLSELIALVAIPAGDEVTHRYWCPPWFDVR